MVAFSNRHTVPRKDVTEDPFGNIVVQTGSEAERNPFRFSTKYHDDLGDPDTEEVWKSGLVYYGFRYYSPRMGRWLSRDPIGERGGVNVYGFVGNDGVNAWDFIGLADPVGSMLRAYYFGRFSLGVVPYYGEAWNRGHKTLDKDLSAEGWDKFMNEDTHSVQQQLFTHAVKQALDSRDTALPVEGGRISVSVDTSLSHAEAGFSTDNYEAASSEPAKGDLSFWLFRPDVVDIKGDVALQCRGSSGGTVWKVSEFALTFTWRDTVDANRDAANQFDILERYVLPFTEWLTGNDYSVVLHWRNSHRAEQQHGKTHLGDVLFRYTATGDWQPRPSLSELTDAPVTRRPVSP